MFAVQLGDRPFRYTTADVELGGVTIPKRELVTINRPNLAQHVTFVQGPHAFIGLHVARAETHAALTAALDWEEFTGQRLTLDADNSSAPTGLIFREAPAVSVTAR